MIKLVIFDFDGTIVDSKSAYYNSITKHVKPLGFSKERISEVIDLGLNLAETLRKFIPSTIYRWWVKRNIMADVLKEVDKIKKCHNVNHIKDIHTKKIVVSNSLSEFVIPILKHLKLKALFREVYCADNFNDKTEFISSYLKAHEINKGECLYVGDRVSDVNLAKKIGCSSVIVIGKCSWNSKKEIIQAEPDFVINDLADLNDIIEKID